MKATTSKQCASWVKGITSTFIYVKLVGESGFRRVVNGVASSRQVTTIPGGYTKIPSQGNNVQVSA